MSDIIIPGSIRKRTNVQIGEQQRVCVLVHADTNRILCFARDDAFASWFAGTGFKKIEILHAHEYDMWAERLRRQATEENAAEDHRYLERENEVRKRLREQLRQRMDAEPEGPGKQAVASALQVLEAMERRRQRYRETFMFQEGYDQSVKTEDVTAKLIGGK